MKVVFNKEALQPMIDWLMSYKKTGVRDEKQLKKILSMDDYQIEFQRYGLEGLPVCGISFDEAVDFFMNFDQKDFENPRLQYKKESFLQFYHNMEERLQKISMFTSISDCQQKIIEQLLVKGLPEQVLGQMGQLNIILIISIGNSMGWPYGNYIDYDVVNLNVFETMEDFLHVTAHEIHHIFLGEMLGCDGIRPEEFFLQNFAYEGLAVHFNNNQETLMKPKKYDDRTYCMQQEDMDFYQQHFDEIFEMIRADYETSKNLSLEEVSDLVSQHYELFEFMGKKVQQYPTYYFGCYMWGLVELKFGKEKLFESIEDPSLFVKLYNQVTESRYQL